MTFTTLGSIEAQDYNLRVWGTAAGTPSVATNNVYKLWGTGSGQYGMGQSMSTLDAAQINPNAGSLTPVTRGVNTNLPTSTVSAIQWTGLVTAINRMRYHQTLSTGSNLSLSGVHVGDTVSAPGTQNAIGTAFNSIDTSLTNCATSMGSGRTATAVALPGVSWNWTFADDPNLRTNFTETVLQWDTGEHARLFFNCGGVVRWHHSAVSYPGGASDRTLAMYDVVNQMGSIFIGYGSGTYGGYNLGTLTGASANGANAQKGYWNMPQGSYGSSVGTRNSGSATYSSGTYCTVYYQVAGSTSANGDRGNQIKVYQLMSSGYGGTGPADPGLGYPSGWATDTMNLSWTSTFDIIAPSVEVLPTVSWSTPAVSTGAASTI